MFQNLVWLEVERSIKIMYSSESKQVATSNCTQKLWTKLYLTDKINLVMFPYKHELFFVFFVLKQLCQFAQKHHWICVGLQNLPLARIWVAVLC